MLTATMNVENPDEYDPMNNWQTVGMPTVQLFLKLSIVVLHCAKKGGHTMEHVTNHFMWAVAKTFENDRSWAQEVAGIVVRTMLHLNVLQWSGGWWPEGRFQVTNPAMLEDPHIQYGFAEMYRELQGK